MLGSRTRVLECVPGRDAKQKRCNEISTRILEVLYCNCAVSDLDNEVPELERKYALASPNANEQRECFPSQCLGEQNTIAVYSS